MSESLTAYTGGALVEWLAADTQFPTPPSTLYVTVHDDTDTELSSDLTNARVGEAATAFTVSGTDFTNDNDINLGEATADLSNVQTVVIYDASSGGNQLLQTNITDAPFDVASGTEVILEAGEINYDAVTYDEANP